ncbi:Oligopeptide transport system permease protein OppC (TC 3.A.1.5.1) [hydrothermal vent metagenome]|uniref:Oligopeptide transport system permease protein OppC (TC 3.A.1.5.1) n=1 Tax=hydrothermal vent metagenome TaxID=652676 RepID=A0A3B1A5E5_9ZZZZ
MNTLNRYNKSLYKTATGIGLLCLLGFPIIAVQAETAVEPTQKIIEVVADVVTDKKAPRATTQSDKALKVVTPEKVKALVDSGIYSLDNDAIGILQNPTEALENFPTNRRHEIDWVKALNDGLITPRANIDGTEVVEPLDMDVLMEQTAMMPHVTFPHQAHTEWLACENCHSEIFEPVKNGNAITMGKILKGEYCGRCHDRVAFSLFVCEKCHNTAQ